MTTSDALWSVWFSHTTDRYGYGNRHYRLKPEPFDLREAMAFPRQYARTIAPDTWVVSSVTGIGPVATHIGVQGLHDPAVHVLRRLPETWETNRVRRSISSVLVMTVADFPTLDALVALLPPHTWTDDMFTKLSVTKFLSQLPKGVTR